MTASVQKGREAIYVHVYYRNNRTRSINGIFCQVHSTDKRKIQIILIQYEPKIITKLESQKMAPIRVCPKFVH